MLAPHATLVSLLLFSHGTLEIRICDSFFLIFSFGNKPSHHCASADNAIANGTNFVQGDPSSTMVRSFMCVPDNQ